MKMQIFFLMIVVVVTTVDMMQAQEISFFKLGSEKCSTKCKSGYLKGFDSCIFNFDVSFTETLPDLSSLNFELMEASSNIYTHLLTLDMKSDCEGYKENVDVYCTELNMNVFSITIKANELSSYSEAKIRAYITTPNKPNVFSGVHEFPKFYATTDAAGELKINGNHMATGSNCNTTIAGKDLTIDFHCISQAKPCMIQLKINENFELQEEENHISYEHIFKSSQAVNVSIQFSACLLEQFYNNMSCTIKTDVNFSDDNNNNNIIAIVASTISIAVVISVAVILFICWTKYIHKKKLPKNEETNAMEQLIKPLEEHNERGHEKLIHKLDVNKRGVKGWTALMLASAHGHVDIVKRLIEKNANIDEQNEQGWTSLMFATRFEHVEIVCILIENKANVNLEEKNGWDALKIAVSMGMDELVDVLTEQNPLCKNRTHDIQSLKKISESFDNNRSIIDKHILDEMIENTPPSNDFETVSTINEELLYVKKESECTAEEILENATKEDILKEQIERTNNAGKRNANDLIKAVCREHEAAVKFLINEVINVNVKTEDGMTALMIASFKGNTKIAGHLLSSNANVNAENDKGLTALMFASYMGHKDLVELLMSNGANLEQVDSQGWNALMHASQNGSIETVNFLLENSFSLDSDKFKVSELSIPAEHNKAISTTEINEFRNIEENKDSITEPNKDVSG